MSNILTEELSEARNLFNRKELYKHFTIENIDCSELPPKDTYGKELPDGLLKKIFAPLHQYDEVEIAINLCPVVYVFELKDKNDRERIIEAFKIAKDDVLNRQLPALKSKIPDSSNLYVGKVEKEIGGRIVTHLGYYQNKSNHGLQIVHWARDMKPSLKLNLNIFRFVKEFRPYVAAMEVNMARRLKPIIGKH